MVAAVNPALDRADHARVEVELRLWRRRRAWPTKIEPVACALLGKDAMSITDAARCRVPAWTVAGVAEVVTRSAVVVPSGAVV